MVLALALLVGSVAAFTRTEKLKLAPAPVVKPEFDRHFSPGCNCRHATSHLSFLLRHRERIDVSVVNADGGHVATLAQGQDAPAGRVGFDWDGRGEDGRVVPDGVYRLKVRLERDRRTILIPSTIHVDTTSPKARVLGVQSGPGLDVRYTSSETARALLVLDGKVVARGAKRRPGKARLVWDGPLPPGSPEVTVVLVDPAGNRSEPTQPVSVASS